MKWPLRLRRGLSIFVGLLAAGAGSWGYLTWSTASISQPALADTDSSGTSAKADSSPAIVVDTVQPRQGDMDRSTSQPGSVQSFESAQLYAGVSGYLKEQFVDIGDAVEHGQVLATVDVPDHDKKVQRYLAGVEQAEAHMTQMQARIESAKADLEAAEAAVTYAEANAKSKAAELRFRQKQLDRMKELFSLKSIDERLVDEKTEQRDTAQEAENAAKASIASAKANSTAARAKIHQAEADLLEAEAEVKVAQAELEKEQAIVQFATITAPFDGVVTHRALFPGDYVRAANEGSQNQPLLIVQRIDKFRVVVQVPDRDVPYTNPGDPAEVELDALPGEKFPAKVSRIAQTEDQQTRLMRVEIDLPNTSGRIYHGMYGRVKILLEKSDLLSIPTSSLAGKSEDGRAAVFVVREGVARKVPILIGEDNGVKVGIASGLSADDVVIRHPPTSLTDGAPVTAANPEREAGGNQSNPEQQRE